LKQSTNHKDERKTRVSSMSLGAETQQRSASMTEGVLNTRWSGGENHAATEDVNRLLLQAYTLSYASFCQ